MIRVGLRNLAFLAAAVIGLGVASNVQAAPVTFASFQQTNSGLAA